MTKLVCWRMNAGVASTPCTTTAMIGVTTWSDAIRGSSNKKLDEIRAYGYEPERMERPDCLLHRLDTRLFPGFAGELQKYLGVKQHMPPSTCVPPHCWVALSYCPSGTTSPRRRS